MAQPALRAAASSGSSYSQSLPRMYWAEILKPKFSLGDWAVRNCAWKRDRSPPAIDTLVPCLSSGEEVIRCMTPFDALGP